MSPLESEIESWQSRRPSRLPVWRSNANFVTPNCSAPSRTLRYGPILFLSMSLISLPERPDLQAIAAATRTYFSIVLKIHLNDSKIGPCRLVEQVMPLDHKRIIRPSRCSFKHGHLCITYAFYVDL